jgi:arginyl-tRNA synthetase
MVITDKMKEEIIKHIENILKEEGVENPIVNLVPSVYLDKGDYSTNVAMVYAKVIDNTPMYLAERIKSHLESRNVFGVTVANPGFINFFFDKKYFGENVREIIENGSEFGKNKNLSGQKTIIEYTDPNPFKEFHIGHLMPNIIGESISRIIEANGSEVKRANYQGDVGLHVAKAVWAVINHNIPLLEAYAYGHKAFSESDVIKNEIIEINKKIYDRSDKRINTIYDEGRKESLDYFENIYKKLGTKFDYYFFESEVADFGKKIVEQNIGNIFEKSEGAVVYKGENFDKKLHTRVFINKENLPTYEAKELGLSKIKYEKYPYDKSVIVTGNEIREYFNVLLSAMFQVFPELAEKTKHLPHGMLRLPEGKMSSRTGNIISSESLINRVTEKVLEKIKNPSLPQYSEKTVRGFSESEMEETSEIIAIGAIKYSILHQAIGGDIVFDFDKSISFEGDSGPYLQYSAVRAHSLLKKAEGVVSVSKNIPENWETTNLERLLERFPDVVARAGSEYAPHYIATYLVELAGEFNSFYAHHKIIDEGDLASPYRLALTQAFYQVMLTGLNLLGIKVPEKM